MTLRGHLAVAVIAAPLLFIAEGSAFTPSEGSDSMHPDVPVLDGYGDMSMPVTTRSKIARDLFRRGMAQAYAFNEVEAIRLFKAALKEDPDCALCAWGVAFQSGPLITAPGRRETDQADRYVRLAGALDQGQLTGKERALIRAVAARYSAATPLSPDVAFPQDICGPSSSGSTSVMAQNRAYAALMRDLAQDYPDDPDVLTLYAEAELLATEGAWWDASTGQPQGRVGELARMLEDAVQRFPAHVGLNHYLIHAVDSAHVAKRAEAAADRLGSLAPKSPHLLHMPSHTFAHLGRYGDAQAVNEKALEADAELRDLLVQRGVSDGKDWTYHNRSFAWYSAVMKKDYESAMRFAQAHAQASGRNVHGDYQRGLPFLTMMRFERWDALVHEPASLEASGVDRVLADQARGVAFARLGRLKEALAIQARLDHVVDRLLVEHSGDDFQARLVRGMAGTAKHHLAAEIHLSKREFEKAIHSQRAAVDSSSDIDSFEPPMLGAGALVRLGEMQLMQGDWKAAETTFRADLAQHVDSPWSREGLSAALDAKHGR